VPLFADEPEALTHPYLARAWAKRGAGLRAEAPASSPARRRDLASQMQRRPERLSKGIALLERLDRIHGPRPLSRIALFPSGAIRERVIASPRPGAACEAVTVALDNGPIHASKAARAAPAERKRWLTPEWLAEYAPELNDIERDWKTLKAHRLAHKTFNSRDSLKATIGADIQAINSSRKSQPLANRRISA